jgi:hypothetical protein
MIKVRCKGCGRWIIFARNGKGKTIPLDPSAPVYAVAEVSANVVQCSRLDSAMVSHFSTCSKADQFSRAHRDSRNDPPETACKAESPDHHVP